MESRIGGKELPPLPDDIDDAKQAVANAQLRTVQAKDHATETYSVVQVLSEMLGHNGFGPRLEEAYRRNQVA